MGWWTELRDSVEAAAVVGGNYFLPGSSLVTSHLVSDGAKEKLNTDWGKLATLGSGGYGAYEGNLANWTGGADAASTGGTVAEGTDSANKAKTLAETTATPAPTTPVGTPGTVSSGTNLTPTYTAGANYGAPTAPGGTGLQMAGTTYTAPVEGTGLQATGFEGNTGAPGLQATPSTFGTSSSALGYGTGGETGIGAPSTGYFADQVPGASVGTGWSLGDMGNAAWEGVKNNKLATAMIGSSLYDMYAKKQMAKKQDELYNQNRADILGMYAPGSPEAKAMEQQMARQDAAAGRNSQYGVRATDYAGNVAKFKANALAQASQAQSGLAAAQMGNQYGGLNSMFNNLAMYSLLNKSTR